MKTLLRIVWFCLFAGTTPLAWSAPTPNPVYELVDRIDPGTSRWFRFEVTDPQSAQDFFEISSAGKKIVVRGNNYVSIAAGLNWYLKHHAGIHVSWNDPHPSLKGRLPRVAKPERRSTDQLVRFYFNYCTYSYSMAFWDWERWQQEIDWMALHGVNMPLALTGTATVWRNTLRTLGYEQQQIDRFIAGPAFQAWFLMNNLEGWGGPNPDSYYQKQEALALQINARMAQWGMRPVFAGYSGMVPRDAGQALGLEIQDPGTWCGFPRPAFLQPTDPRFAEIADTYYKEFEKLFGKGCYFSMDPFHEGGSVAGVDLNAAGRAIYDAMKRHNPESRWVIQSWQDNPRRPMIDSLPKGDLLVLDLWSEGRPQWGDPRSLWYRPEGFGKHEWVYCMLTNFGGNVGLFGKLQRVIDGYYLARSHPNGATLRGVGATPEAIENNTVLHELIFELPWIPEKPSAESWLAGWIGARYGSSAPELVEAWRILARSVYAPPYESVQEGATETIFCLRPSQGRWKHNPLWYDPRETCDALRSMLDVADRYRGNKNFEYDLVDIARQATTDQAVVQLRRAGEAFDAKDMERFRAESDRFLDLLLMQDRLLGSQPGFLLGTWLNAARSQGDTPAEKDWYEWNARTQITVWGNHYAANTGGLRDYAHKEWSGLLRDFYQMRWRAFFDALYRGEAPPADYYPMEQAWTLQTNSYPAEPTGDPVDLARETLIKLTLLL